MINGFDDIDYSKHQRGSSSLQMSFRTKTTDVWLQRQFSLSLA
jgi:hypothetical protein